MVRRAAGASSGRPPKPRGHPANPVSPAIFSTSNFSEKLSPCPGRSKRDSRRPRLPGGQLLVRLLAEFRRELLDEAESHGYGDIRLAHLQITGNIGTKGIRLTVLAARAQLSLAATSELVNELQPLGYLERMPDATDARAKLIFPSSRGLQMLGEASAKVQELEQLLPVPQVVG